MPDDSANDFVVTAPDDTGTTPTSSTGDGTTTATEEPVVVEVYEAIVDPFESGSNSPGEVAVVEGPVEVVEEVIVVEPDAAPGTDGTSGAGGSTDPGTDPSGTGSGTGSDDTPGVVAGDPDGTGSGDPSMSGSGSGPDGSTGSGDPSSWD